MARALLMGALNMNTTMLRSVSSAVFAISLMFALPSLGYAHFSGPRVTPASGGRAAFESRVRQRCLKRSSLLNRGQSVLARESTATLESVPATQGYEVPASRREAAIDAVREHISQNTNAKFEYEIRIPQRSAHPLLRSVYQVVVRTPRVRAANGKHSARVAPRLFTVVESDGEMILFAQEPATTAGRALAWIRDRGAESVSEALNSPDVRASLRDGFNILVGGGVGTAVTQDPTTFGATALLALANTIRHIPGAIRRGNVARKEAMEITAGWAEQVQREMSVYPTLDDAYEHYLYVLAEASPGSRPVPRGANFVREFGQALLHTDPAPPVTPGAESVTP